MYIKEDQERGHGREVAHPVYAHPGIYNNTYFLSYSEAQGRVLMSQGGPGEGPWPNGGSPCVCPPRGLPEVLRVPERHNPQGTGLLAGRSLQRGDPAVR